MLKDKTLFAGFVDGINVWKTDVKDTLRKVEKLSEFVDNIVVTNAGPLFHLPVTLENEKNLPEYLYQSLSFATEKLGELSDIQSGDSIGYRNHIGDGDTTVQNRVASLNDNDFVKSLDVVERRKLQDEILNLPELPTTTIGSFPQTKDVRLNRLDHKKARIETYEYNNNIRQYVR